MKGAVWGFFGLLGALWSLLAWVLHGIAGSGGAAVVTVSRWLDIEPSSTQWLADGLTAAGWLAQLLVVFIWLAGAGLLGLFGWMGGRVIDGVDGAGRMAGRSAPGFGPKEEGPLIEGDYSVGSAAPAEPAGSPPAGTR